MKITKQKVSLTFAVAIAASLFSSNAAALPAFAEIAPQESIEVCVAQIGEQANYEGAGRVLHEVASKKRPITGYTLTIDTTVFDATGEAIQRQYATRCVVRENRQTKVFEIKELAE